MVQPHVSEDDAQARLGVAPELAVGSRAGLSKYLRVVAYASRSDPDHAAAAFGWHA